MSLLLKSANTTNQHSTEILPACAENTFFPHLILFYLKLLEKNPVNSIKIIT